MEKTISIIFAVLAALSAAAYFAGHGNHLITLGVCLAMAFIVWPEEKEAGHE